MSEPRVQRRRLSATAAIGATGVVCLVIATIALAQHLRWKTISVDKQVTLMDCWRRSMDTKPLKCRRR